MSRIGGDDPVRGEREAVRRAAEDGPGSRGRRLSNPAELAGLAAEIRPALDPDDARGPESLGRVLGAAQGLAAEARASFASGVAREHGQSLRALVDASCPPGTERRERLGRALVASAGGKAADLNAQAIESVVRQAVASLSPTAAGPSLRGSASPSDLIERAPARLFDPGGASSRMCPETPPPPRPGLPGPTHAAAPMSQPTRRLPSTGALSPTPPQPPAVDVDREAPGRALAGLRGSAAGPAPTDASAPVAAMAPVPAIVSGAAKNVWRESAARILGPRLQSIIVRLGTLEAKLESVSAVLDRQRAPTARVQHDLGQAAALVEEALFKATVAHELTVGGSSARDVLLVSVAARQQVSDLRTQALAAKDLLRDASSGAERFAPGASEIGDIDRLARESHAELTLFQGAGQTLEGVRPDGSQGLSEADFRRLGSGLDLARPAPQNHWTDPLVSNLSILGRKQGGIGEDEANRHAELSRRALSGALDPNRRAADLGAADVAALLKLSGIDLARVDPSQLQAAARYVDGGLTRTDQEDKLRMTLDNFQVLTTKGAPRLARGLIVEQLWALARVPGHALARLSDAELQAKFQEVVASVNAGPGATQIKLGQYTLKITVGANGQVLESSCKKPGLLSKIWGAIKKIAPVALTALSFIPATAPFAKAAQAVVSLVGAIKRKSLIGIATAAAGVVGGVGAIASRGAQAASRLQQVASSVARTLQGVSSLRSGNLLGGLATLGSGLASGAASFAASAEKGLGLFADRMLGYSTKLSAAATATASLAACRAARRALSEARQALADAQAAGDPARIASARQGLERAERQQRTAIAGAAAGALQSASLLSSHRGLSPGRSRAPAPAKSGLDSQLQLAARGLGVARDVSAHDFVAAGVGGLSVAATLGGDGENALNDAAHLAGAGLEYARNKKALTASDQAVEEAGLRLIAAKALGDREQIAKAERDVEAAHRSRDSALMAGIAAGESLQQTAETIARERRSRGAARGPVEEPASGVLQKARDGAAAVAASANSALQLMNAWVLDDSAPREARDAAAAAAEALAAADRNFGEAMSAAGSDPEGIAAARDALAQAVRDAEARNAEIERIVVEADKGAVGPAPEASGALFASKRPPPQVGRITIKTGLTVWEVSQRTGIPEDRILAFNAAMGNPLELHNLQVGQGILVPLGADEQKFPPRSASEIAALREAAARPSSPSTAPEAPSLQPAEVSIPELPLDRTRALIGVENDLRKVADDVLATAFSWGDPSSWIDTKDDDARLAARDAYQQSAERLRDILSDPGSTSEDGRAAQEAAIRARLAFDAARSVVERAAATADYLTPLAEATQDAQDALHQQAERGREAIVDGLGRAGVAPAFVGASTVPLELVESAIDFEAGVLKGLVFQAQDAAALLAHPGDAAESLAMLAAQAAQATTEGRNAQFLLDVATGQFATVEEAYAAWREKASPIAVAQAQTDIGFGLVKAVLSRSIELAQEGKFQEAAGVFFGQSLDVGAAIGVARGLGLADEAADAAARAAAATAELARTGAVDAGAGAAAFAAGATDTTALPTALADAVADGAQAAAVADRLATKGTAPALILESKGADVTRRDRVVGSASVPKAINTSIRPSIAEADAYKAALLRGEIGLQRPAHANAPGADFLTAVRDAITGQYSLVVTDVKASTVGQFPQAPTSLSAAWMQELEEALAPGRLDLGSPALEAQMRTAFAQGRVSIRRITLDYSGEGQGAMQGF